MERAIQISRRARCTDRLVQNKGSKSMRIYVSCIALGAALAACATVANAQSLITQPHETLIIQPSGTLVTRMPLVAASAGVVQPIQTVQTIQIVRVARPAVRRQIVARHTTTHRVAAATYSRPIYNTAVAPAVQTFVAQPVAIAPASGQALNMSGQFLCVQGCAGGLVGPAIVTQNGWDLNLVNELGQPTRAWIDWPGHIWAQSWNEGAIYSPDGMTIQFDNGTVWQRNVELMVLPLAPPGGR
jgi:hypothetical protein